MQSRVLWVIVISKDPDVRNKVLAMHCANADWQITDMYRVTPGFRNNIQT